MSRSSRDTGHYSNSRSRVGHISTRSCLLGCPCRLTSSPKSPERTVCAHPQLPQWLAHTCTVSWVVVHTQGPQPVGSSGQLRKEQTRANAEDLFSWRAVDALSRQLTFPREWRLHTETIRLICSRFAEAQVDLFASRESSNFQLYFSLTESPLDTDALAHSWALALCKYVFPQWA